MDKDHLSNQNDWYEKIAALHLPRWQELPEIDLYMDQVIVLMEKYLSIFTVDSAVKLITPSMINNYVKQGLIPPPVKKRYARCHIAYLLMICILKQILAISTIRSLINIRLEYQSIEDVFNYFADEYEKILSSSLTHAQQQISSFHLRKESETEAISRLSFQMVMQASVSKTMAEKLVSLHFCEQETQDKSS